MLIVAIVGYVISIVANIIVIVDAFKNGGSSKGMLCLLLPFYSLYWAFFQMGDNRRLVVGCWIVGFILSIVPVVPKYIQASSTLSAINTASKRDVCSLLTTDQIGAALKEAYDPGEKITYRGAAGCNYRDTATSTHNLRVASLACDASMINKLPLGEKGYQVPDLGEQAVLSEGNLVARKGTYCFFLAVDGAPSEATIGGRKKLMRTLMADLQ